MTARPGFWESDLDEARAVAASQEYSQLQLAANGDIYWITYDPGRAGANLICRECSSAPGQIEELTPEGFSVQSKVHEYGGQSWCLLDTELVFVNAADQQLYLQSLSPDSQPRKLTHYPDSRFIEPLWDSCNQRLIAVEELHQQDEVINRLVCIDPVNGQCAVLHQGYDFYAYPSLHPQGSELAVIVWQHPHQPWTSTSLLRISLDAQGLPEETQVLAGPVLQGSKDNDKERAKDSDKEEALSQPLYDAAGDLYVVSDRSGWWNIYRVCPASAALEPICAAAADMMPAPWQSGLRHYALCYDWPHSAAQKGCEPDLIHLQYKHQGSELYWAGKQLDLEFSQVKSLLSRGNKLVAIAASATGLPAVIEISVNGDVRPICGGDQPLGEQDCSLPEAMTFSKGECEEKGKEKGKGEQCCYGYFYRPRNTAYSAAAEADPGVSEQGVLDKRVPLVIFLHGGPTAATYPVLNLKIQYWTQRGFAVLDLNYRGSSNYGRDYRNALKHRWGPSETEDIKLAVTSLIREQGVDPGAIFIRGNSSGGYTALNALAELDCFTAGASLYGVTDPLVLSQCTHKFESHYLNWLIGDPERDQDRYRAYAPLYKVDAINAAVIFFQGEQDKVVLPEQTRTMLAELQAKGVTAEAHFFADEAHGFRKAENQIRVLREELAFYQRQMRPA